jgi:hypothetical protein
MTQHGRTAAALEPMDSRSNRTMRPPLSPAANSEPSRENSIAEIKSAARQAFVSAQRLEHPLNDTNRVGRSNRVDNRQAIARVLEHRAASRPLQFPRTCTSTQHAMGIDEQLHNRSRRTTATGLRTFGQTIRARLAGRFAETLLELPRILHCSAGKTAARMRLKQMHTRCGLAAVAEGTDSTAGRQTSRSSGPKTRKRSD